MVYKILIKYDKSPSQTNLWQAYGTETVTTNTTATSSISKAEFKKLIGIKPTLISLFSKAMKYGIAACVVCILTFGGYKYYGNYILSNTSRNRTPLTPQRY